MKKKEKLGWVFKSGEENNECVHLLARCKTTFVMREWWAVVHRCVNIVSTLWVELKREKGSV